MGCALIALPILCVSSHAVDGTWTNNANSTWGTAANWFGGTIADGIDGVADFSTINITANRTVTLNTSRSIGTLRFGDTTPSANWILDASVGSILTLQVTAGTPTIDVVNQTATISLVLAGSQGLDKTGAGVLVLSGANTYSGDTTISAGTLRFGTATSIPSGTGKGNVVVGASGTLDISSVGGSINGLSGSGIVDKSATGTDTLTVGNNDATTEFSGIIRDTTGTLALTKTGAGTLTLSGASANTYSGLTTVNAGTLVLNKSSGNAIGGSLTISGGTVQLAGSDQIANASAVTVSGTGLLDLNGNSDAIGTLSMTAGSITTGAGTLTLGGAVTGNASANSATVSGNLNLGGATRTFTIADGGAAEDMAISANISNGGITKAGAGTLTLSGANTYAGVTTVGAGVLRLNSAGALGGGNLTFTGGTLGLGAGDFTRALGTGTGQVQFTAGTGGGFAAYGADRVVNLGGASAGVTWNSGGFVLTGDALILGAADATHTVDFQNPINLNGAGRTVQVADGAAAVDGILSGVISGTGASALSKSGTGTLLLTGENTFAGGVSVTAGTLVFGSDTAAGTGTITLSSGVTLQGSGGTRTITNNLSVNSVTFSGSDLIFTDSFDQGTARTYTVENTTTFSGNITGGDALAKSGSGTLILSGNNTIGTVTVNAGGALRAANSGALGTTVAGTTVNSGGALELFGGIAIGTEALSLSGTGVGGGGALRNVGGNNSWAGTITLANVTGPHRINSDSGLLTVTGGITETGAADNKNLTFGGAGNITVSGNITADPGDMLLTKDGAGTLTLTGTNTYNGGTTINEGRLVVNNLGGSGTGSGAVVVNNTGIVGGNGTISGGLTLNSGGAVAAGNSVGQLNTGSETWNGGASYIWEINDVDAGDGIGWDVLNINGSLIVNATSGNQFGIDVRSLTLADAPGAVNDWDPTQDYVWTIAKTVSGISFALGEDESTVFQLLLGGFTAHNNLQGGTFSLQVSGNDLDLVFQAAPIPEPGTWTMILLGLGGLAWRLRSNRRG